MKKSGIDELIMSRLFASSRKDLDPNDWQTHVTRNIVHEVRLETLRFYGPTDCLEAQYPGLDYSKLAHRRRLEQFPYHKKLFRAFDQLRLTDSEIHTLCNWEGTRFAREAYEANNNIKIRDTTWDGVANHSFRSTNATQISLRGGNVEPEIDQPPESMESGAEAEDEEMEDTDREEGSEIDTEDEMPHSVGVELNQRLLAATEARARGENVIIDADWEQWLKEAAERGAQTDMLPPPASASAPATAPQTPVYWGREIPEYLSDNPTPENAAIQASLPPPPQYIPHETTNISITASILRSAPQTGTAS